MRKMLWFIILLFCFYVILMGFVVGTLITINMQIDILREQINENIRELERLLDELRQQYA